MYMVVPEVGIDVTFTQTIVEELLQPDSTQ
jgi:hypothetical protein